jgi:hypothetical protein
MNERIRALAEQAGITTNLDTDYYEQDMNKWMEYYSEKFAEMIIQESIKVMIQNDYHGDWLGEKIKEHFGVELCNKK